MGETFFNLILRLILTLFFYLFIPIVLTLIVKPMISLKRCKYIAIANAFIIWFLFQLFYFSHDISYNNTSPALLWGTVGYIIMKKNIVYDSYTVHNRRKLNIFKKIFGPSLDELAKMESNKIKFESQHDTTLSRNNSRHPEYYSNTVINLTKEEFIQEEENLEPLQPKNEQPWNYLFPNISDIDIKITKILTYCTLQIVDKMKEDEKIIKSYTTGQRCETIGFIKSYLYFTINDNPIHHNLFYGFMHSLYLYHYREALEDTLLQINLIKESEKWYIKELFMHEDDEKEDIISRMKERYFNSLNRFKNEDTDTQVKFSKNTLNQLISPYLEEVHQLIMCEELNL